MLYVRENNSQIEIRRTKSYGNAGDQIKVNGSTRIENSLMVSNCGYFNGKSFTYNVGDCRAGGSALVFSMRRGSEVSVVNSTLVGQGDCLLIVQCDTEAVPPCDGSETAIVQNNIFQGHQEFMTDDTTCYVWLDRDNFYQTQEDYNVIHPDTKLGEFQYGSHDIFQDPLFVNANLETFDGDLQAGSPAIDSGLQVGSLNDLIPSDDLTHATRPYGSGVDRGAYEYGGTACTYSISPTGQSFSVSGGSDTVNVTAPSGCLWTAASNANWIIITSSTSGSGNGSVNYTVSPNTGPDRMGTLNIGGRTFTVSQTGVQQAETVSTPNPPTGPDSGIIGTDYSFTTDGATSSLGHTIEYRFDWGDGTFSDWLPVGTTSASKSWTYAGNYAVKVQARCATDTYVVSNWSGTLSVNITSNPTLIVLKSGTGSGTVTSSPSGINCGNDCTEVYIPGTKVTLTAKADANSTFTGWSDGGCSGKGKCIVIMDTDTSVTATFSAKIPDISVAQTTLEFGSIKVGKKKTKTLKITNNGTGDLVITLAGLEGTDFSIQGSSSVTIKGKKSYSLKVLFMPKSAGIKTAQLEIHSNDPDTPTLEISLSGTGQ